MDLREAFLPTLFGGEEDHSDMRKIHGHLFKQGGLGIPEHQDSARFCYSTSMALCGELVVFLLGSDELKYVSHRLFICSASKW